MRLFGIILIAIGIYGMWFSMNMDTTIEASKTELQIWEITTRTPSERIYNLGLISQSLDWLIVSSVVIVSGVLFYGFGVLRNQKIRNEQRDIGIPKKSILPELGDKPKRLRHI
jgi:hypothetical protein